MVLTRLMKVSNRVMKRYVQTQTSKLDPVQDKAMNEMCILIDEDDKAIGYASKRDCHRVTKDRDIPLHRAFSVLLFNSKNEMLLQRRSSTKITFPGHISNTCCSHPLYEIDCERDENNALGIKLAAQRRLNMELGISQEQANIDSMHYLTRIHYMSLGDGVWGEHEIDYILIMQKDVHLNPNPDEVSDVYYVPQNELCKHFRNINSPLTPWFKYLEESGKLQYWWNNLHRLDEITEQSKIYRVSNM